MYLLFALDPESYKEEFLAQQQRFESKLKLLELQPSKEDDDFVSLVRPDPFACSQPYDWNSQIHSQFALIIIISIIGELLVSYSTLLSGEGYCSIPHSVANDVGGEICSAGQRNSEEHLAGINYSSKS